MMVDRESQRIDSTDDLVRETDEIQTGTGDAAETAKKPLISPVVKWVLLADFAIVVVVVGFFLIP